MDDRIKVTVSDGVADVRLSRPEKMNALDDAMFEALITTGERLKADSAVRAVVLSGEGRAFCAGLDSGKFGDMTHGGFDTLVGRSHGIANRPQYAVLVWREVAAPVIAALHGVAFGGGLQLALGCDIRLATPDARLSIMEIKWGLVPDMAATQLMRGLVRDDVARELTYTGRTVSGEEAAAIGLVTRTEADPYARALDLAREIAGKNPHAVRAAKRLFNAAPYLDLAAGLEAESREEAALIGAPNQVEAVMANLEKRAPEFKD